MATILQYTFSIYHIVIQISLNFILVVLNVLVNTVTDDLLIWKNLVNTDADNLIFLICGHTNLMTTLNGRLAADIISMGSKNLNSNSKSFIVTQ